MATPQPQDVIEMQLAELSQPSGGENGGNRNDAPTAAMQPTEIERVTFRACFLGLVASMGGLIFGYVRYFICLVPPTNQHVPIPTIPCLL